MNLLNILFVQFGYEDFNTFVNSAFHPKTGLLAVTISSSLATLGYYFENFLGFEPVIGMVMVGLFITELSTGIKASIREGNKFESQKFGRAFIKMIIYVLMIGFANILATGMEVKSIFGLEFNYYEWLHYAFLNYVLINLFISNVENFERLGWNEFVPLLGRLSSFLKLKKKDDTI